MTFGDSAIKVTHKIKTKTQQAPTATVVNDESTPTPTFMRKTEDILTISQNQVQFVTEKFGIETQKPNPFKPKIVRKQAIK